MKAKITLHKSAYKFEGRWYKASTRIEEIEVENENDLQGTIEFLRSSKLYKQVEGELVK